MKRRRLLALLACGPAAAVEPTGEVPRPRHKVSAAQLHQALSDRFPLRLGHPGLLELQVSAPALLLLPGRNKLGASLLAQASGPALRGDAPAGTLDLVFGLRYEPGDRTLRAEAPELLELRLPGAPAAVARRLRDLLGVLLREGLGGLVVHQFTPRELALPAVMGFEPEGVTVVADGLFLTFRPKARITEGR